MNRLSDRLAQIRKSGIELIKTRTAESRESNACPPGEKWQQTADFAWERQLIYPSILPEELNSGFILPVGTRSDELVFYDLETTGLSSGAGNTAFLIGLGWQRRENFLLTQLFLADYPGETEMLERFAHLTKAHRHHLSYNGLSFDSQVLNTRFLLNRLPPPSSTQIDLLHPARRLWRRLLPNLGLKTVETDILNFFRPDDLPGNEAPEAWFRWLKDKPDRIEGVFQHNADDIVSLARLLARMEEWGQYNPQKQTPRPEGVFPRYMGMARQWEKSNSGKAFQWLESGWMDGDVNCGLELANRYKRRRNFLPAVEIWDVIHNAYSSNLRAAVELAMYWEHHQKDPRQALKIVNDLEDRIVAPKQKDALLHRKLRLENKIHQVNKN